MGTVSGWLQQLDRATGEAVVGLRTPVLDVAFRLLSQILWFKLAVLGTALAVGRARGSFRPGLTVAVTLLATTLATTALKSVFGRLRPPLDDHAITALVPLPGDASFPSGHASGAFAAAVALGLLVPRARVPALVVAALVAFSRIWLGVHYLSDVIAGALLGSAIALAADRVSGRSRPGAAAPGERARPAPRVSRDGAP